MTKRLNGHADGGRRSARRSTADTSLATVGRSSVTSSGGPNPLEENPIIRCLLPCIVNKAREDWSRVNGEHERSHEEHRALWAHDIIGSQPEQRDIDKPTQPSRWFTPRDGWPEKDAAGRQIKWACGGLNGHAPPDLIGSARKDPQLFLPVDMELGTLRVELLETDDLPQMDNVLDANDVYALVVFEDTAACTNVIENVNSPAWSAEHARAFRFPIFSPASALHVAVFDSDAGDAANVLDSAVTGLIDGIGNVGNRIFDTVRVTTGGRDTNSALQQRLVKQESIDALVEDDPIGRVIIEVRSLVPGVVYDSWFELRHSGVLDDSGQHGAIRLRYSVEWKSERARIVKYLSTPPEFFLPVPAKYEPMVEFTLKGKVEGSFDFNVLLDHAYELKDGCKGGVYGIIDSITGIIFYESPLESLLACALWQLVLMYPSRFLPICFPLWLLSLFRRTHREARQLHTDVHSFPPFEHLVLQLLLPRAICRWLMPSPPTLPKPPPPPDGLIWADTGTARPLSGTEIVSAELSAAILEKLEDLRSHPAAPPTSLPPSASPTRKVLRRSSTTKLLGDSANHLASSTASDGRLRVEFTVDELRELGVRALLHPGGFVKTTRRVVRAGGLTSTQTLYFVPERKADAPPPPPLTQEDILERRGELKQAARAFSAKAAEEQAQFEHLVTSPDGGKLAENLRNLTNGAGNVLKGGVGGVGAVLETTGATLGTSVGELAQGNVIGAGSSLVTNVGKTAVTSVTAVARVGVGAVREAVRGIGSTVEGATKVDPTQLLEPYLGWVQVSLVGKLVYIRTAKGVLTWSDPVLTTWIVLLLLGLVLFLPWLPWLLIGRVGGAALLGPHMLLVGRWYKAPRVDEAPPLSELFANEPDPSRRQKLVEGERKKRKEEERKLAAEEEARKRKLPLSEYAQARRGRVDDEERRVRPVEITPAVVPMPRARWWAPDKQRSSRLPPHAAFEHAAAPSYVL